MNEAAVETVVAVVPQVQDEEQTLAKEVTDIEFRAESFLIQTEEEYSAAGEFGKELKKKSAAVTAFFKPMKDNAYQAHRAICEREKAMLAPLQNAEKIIKRSMSAYVQEQERKRREAEEAMRRAAEAERERMLAEAAARDAAGDTQGAEEAFSEAVVMDEATRYTAPAAPSPKVAGVSTSKDWEIDEIVDAAVPVEWSGMELRPVDRAAVMRLIRASKGSIKIPGVSYHEVAKMSFRR